MERVTISLDEGLLAAFDAFARRKGYENRSEAMRDLVRRSLEQDRLDEGRAAHAVACLSYVYDHEERELARRLARSQHRHHDLMCSTLHVHLDHENCLEVVLLQGPTRAVRSFAEATIAETGVRHGNVHLIPVDMVTGHHRHDYEHGRDHEHEHGRDHGHGESHDHNHDHDPAEPIAVPGHRHIRPQT